MPDISPKTALIIVGAIAGIIFLLVVIPEVFGQVFGSLQKAAQDMIETARGIKIPVK